MGCATLAKVAHIIMCSNTLGQVVYILNFAAVFFLFPSSAAGFVLDFKNMFTLKGSNIRNSLSY